MTHPRYVFAAAVNCIDGRTQLPLLNYMKMTYNIDFLDLITEPGPDRWLSQGTPAQVGEVRRRVEVSVNAHHSKIVAIAAHYDCAGNPVDEAEHKQMVRDAVRVIEGWNLGVRVVGLWINQNWWVDPIIDTGAP